MMDRRGFLQGVFGGITAAGVIVSASPSEIEAFAAPLVRDAPVVLDVPPAPDTHVGQHLYNARGQLVAFITSVDVIQDRVEVTSAFGSNRLFVPGPRFVKIHADAIGQLVWDSYTKFPSLTSSGDQMT
jgi:hypothetical protein